MRSRIRDIGLRALSRYASAGVCHHPRECSTYCTQVARDTIRRRAPRARPLLTTIAYVTNRDLRGGPACVFGVSGYSVSFFSDCSRAALVKTIQRTSSRRAAAAALPQQERQRQERLQQEQLQQERLQQEQLQQEQLQQEQQRQGQATLLQARARVLPAARELRVTELALRPQNTYLR